MPKLKKILFVLGKLLFLGIRNKYCAFCSREESNNISPIPSHKCFKNWKNSSTSMESDIIVEGFRKSTNMHGIKYLKLVGDGDSSVYKKLLESRPYGTTLVKKIECRNHLLRNFCKRLREICGKFIIYKNKLLLLFYIILLISKYFFVAGKKRSNSSNCPVAPKLRKMIENNIVKIRKCVTKAIAFRISENTDIAKKTVDLTKDLNNSVKYIFGDHEECKELKYLTCTNQTVNHLPEGKACCLYEDINICMNRLVLNAASLLLNMDTNRAELYNSVVCKFVGGKRVNFSRRGSYNIRDAKQLLLVLTPKIIIILWKKQ